MIVGLAAAAVPLVAPNEPAEALLLWPEQRTAPADPVMSALDADEAPQLNATELATSLGPLLEDSALDGDLAATVLDGHTGEELYAAAQDDAMEPASSAKMVTAAAVLATRGASYRIPTRVVAGDGPGEVVVVAGGDVTLTEDGDGYYHNAAELSDLAEQAREALGGDEVNSLAVDSSIFEDDELAPEVEPSTVDNGHTADLTAFMIDGGRTDPAAANTSARHSDPTEAAAEALAAHLGENVTVTEGVAPPDSEELGVVYSPPMQQLIEVSVVDSDNVLSDALARQPALERDRPGSFEGGVEAAMEVLSELDVPTSNVLLADGSGLSTENLLTTAALATLMQRAADPDYPQLSSLYSALPVGGYSGTLGWRFDAENSDGAGVVRAKTGTLPDISSLTGTVVDSQGRLLVFSFIVNDRGDQYAAEAALDAAAVGLSQCGCR